jgi:hypothetical protein
MQVRDQIPHFSVRDSTGATIDYGVIWQRKHLVLVSLPPDGHADTETGPARAYAERLGTACADLSHAGIVYVVTHDPVPGVPSPGAVVADRWGEVVFVSPAGQSAPPSPNDLAEWARMTAMRCG